MSASQLYFHRSRFVDYTPPSITALAFSHPALPKTSPVPSSLRLAIGRSNGDIEIWRPLEKSWYHESTLKGGKGRSIEGLAWTQDTSSDGSQLRLFSIGYSSMVTEWDLQTGRPLKHVDCNGPRVYREGKEQGNTQQEQLGQNLVVGLEDGSVALLSTDGGPGSLEYKKTLRNSSKKARVLCLIWQNRSIVVAGMADSTIRIWDTRSGRLVTRMSTGRESKKRGMAREALIWAVKVLQNGDIVSGDSRGEVLFWDGKTYSLRQRIKAHEADVLTLEVNRSGDMVVSSGVDRRTVFFGMQKGGQQKGRWAEIAGRRFHSHDVRAMAAWEGNHMSIVVSGGIDMKPVVIPFEKYNSENYYPINAIPQKPIVTSVPESRLLMSWYDREIKIWAIDELDKVTNSAHQLDPENMGRKLISRLVLGNEENITCAHITAISRPRAGYVLAVATNGEIKLFHLRPPKANSYGYALRVSKVELPSTFHIQKGRINCDSDSMEEDSSVDSDKDDDDDDELDIVSDGARLLQFSPDGKWLLVITPASKAVLLPISTVERESETRTRINVFVKPEAFCLNRIPRILPHERISQESNQKHKTGAVLDYGHLGGYPHTISRVAFSSNSRILVVTDLSGHLDSYVLRNSAWEKNPTGRLLPKLEYPVAAMEFRPSSRRQMTGMDQEEDRLMIITAHQQDVFEFHVLKGKLTEWSRRNPPSHFLENFKIIREIGSGIVWEIEGRDSPSEKTIFDKERVWFWGPNWIWMFDLRQDLPDRALENSNKVALSSTNKRKRGKNASTDEKAGSVPYHINAGRYIAPKDGKQPKPTDNDGDIIMHDDNALDVLDDDDNARWGNFRRASLNTLPNLDGSTSADPLTTPSTDLAHGDKTRLQQSNNNRTTKPYWYITKYRPIMGLLPIGLWSSGNDNSVDEDNRRHTENQIKELVVVERPPWDIELPPRFFGRKERNEELTKGLW
ncbi:quinon protein alcohol dehydrogenase-like superfamily [Kalaharituber pfeilii]|nr:quinon protein alcohol dehydrogenase-like superfamily [Kalaharituber pfeilii]